MDQQTKKLLKYVYDTAISIAEWSEEYPVVFRWGWRDGPLSMKEAMEQPEFG